LHFEFSFFEDCCFGLRDENDFREIFFVSSHPSSLYPITIFNKFYNLKTFGQAKNSCEKVARHKRVSSLTQTTRPHQPYPTPPLDCILWLRLLYEMFKPIQFIFFLAASLAVQANSLQAQSPIEVYDAGKTYSVGALVLVGDESYIATGASTGLNPFDNSNVWQNLSASASS
jgi:hypothetical protein